MAFRDRLPHENQTQSETNPYNPEVPAKIQDMSPELHDYLVSLNDTIRTQHNKGQAGDTTFPWQVLTSLDDSPQYTLGSNGKFSHPDFGLIRGTYVQFDSMSAAPDNPGVVAFVRLGTWIASNQISKSSDKIPRGVLCSYTLPSQGQYGWIVTTGINLQSLRVRGTKPRGSDVLSWEDDGTLSVNGKSARQIGRVTDSTNLMQDGEYWWVGAGGARLELGDGGFIVSRAVQAGQTALTADLKFGEQIVELRQYLELVIGQERTSLEILSRRVTVLTADRASVEYTERLTAAANFSNLAGVHAANAGFAASLTNVNLVAVNELTRMAAVYRTEAGYYAESSSRSTNSAALEANNSAVSAQASAVSEQRASVKADAAGISATAARTSELTAKVSADNSSASATQSDYARSQAEIQAGNSAASAETSRGFKDQAQVQAGNSAASATQSDNFRAQAVVAKDGSVAAATTSREQADRSTVQADRSTAQATVSQNASTQAGNFAASAQSAAVVAASLSGGSASETMNPRFASFGEAANINPNSWIDWKVEGNYRRVRATPGIGSPYAFRTLNDIGNVESGFYQQMKLTPGRYTVDVTLEVNNGGIGGAGITLGNNYNIDFVADADIEGKTGNQPGVRTWTKTFDISREYLNASNGFVNLFAFMGWTGFGRTIDPKYVTWYFVNLRHLGAPENMVFTVDARVTTESQASVNRDGALGTRVDQVITAYKAADAVVDARVTSEATASSNRDGALGTRIDQTIAAYKAADQVVDARVTSEATASANRDGALGQRIDNTVAQYNGLESRVTTNSTAIANAEGKLLAYFQIVAQTPGSRTQLTITAGGDNPGFDLVGNVRIFGNLIVNGTVQSEALVQSAVQKVTFRMLTYNMSIPRG